MKDLTASDKEILLQLASYVKTFRFLERPRNCSLFRSPRRAVETSGSGGAGQVSFRGRFPCVDPLFITVEGLDGSGKSTQLRFASRWLEQRRIAHRVTQEPGGTPLGDAIRSVFLNRQDDWTTVDGTVEALLIFASRRQHLLEIIDPTLATGRHVLCDRFTDSTLAYQGYGRGCALEILERVDELATGSRVPDKTLLFDLPPEVARNRGHSLPRQNEPGGVDRLDAEDLAFYDRVREGYLKLAAADPERFIRIDATGSVEQIHTAVATALSEIFGVD